MGGTSAQRPQLLALWCLLLLTVGGRVRALPGLGRHGIYEDILRSSTARHLMTEKLPEPAAPQKKPPTFEEAPNCRALPNATNSQPDRQGRLWGWKFGASCAYKDKDDHVLLYVGYYPGNWLLTPMCKGEPFSNTSVADSRFKVWDWEGGRLCAFKDDQQQPIPLDRLYNKLTWADAPACTGSPEPTNLTAVPDRLGCLWGWQLDRNCAFKNSSTNEAKYYDSYGQACNATLVPSTTNTLVPSVTNMTEDLSAYDGQLVAAAVKPEDIQGTQDTNDVSVTGVATQIGNKALPDVYTPEEVQMLFGSNNKITVAEGGQEPQRETQMTDFQPPYEIQQTPIGAATSIKKTSHIVKLSKLDQPEVLVGIPDKTPTNSPSAPPAKDKTDITALSGRQLLSNNQEVVRKVISRLDADDNPCVRYGWSGRGLGDPMGPWHASKAKTICEPMTPDGDRKQFAASQKGGGVTYPPASLPMDESARGINAILPDTRGTDKPIIVETESIVIAEGGQLPQEDFLGPASHPGLPRQAPMKEIQPTKPQGSTPPTTKLPAVLPENKTGSTVPHARRLRGLWPFPTITSGAVASATAVSKGGSAVSQSKSNSQGNSTASSSSEALAAGNSTATSLSSANATAAPNGSATSIAGSSAIGTGEHDAASTASSTTVAASNTTAKCVVLANSVNKKAELSCVDTPATKASNHADKDNAPGAWGKALPCMETPTKSNTVMDTLSRLWGLANSKKDLCAHKTSNGATLKYADYEPLEWNTSAPCSGLPNSSNSMPDASGRLWGWSNSGDNCAFKDAIGLPNYYPAYFAELDMEAASNKVSASEADSCVNCVNPSGRSAANITEIRQLELAEIKVDTIGITPDGAPANNRPAVNSVLPPTAATSPAPKESDDKKDPASSGAARTNPAHLQISSANTHADPLTGPQAARYMQLLKEVLANKLGL